MYVMMMMMMMMISDYSGFSTTELLFNSYGDHIRDKQEDRKCAVRTDYGEYDRMTERLLLLLQLFFLFME